MNTKQNLILHRLIQKVSFIFLFAMMLADTDCAYAQIPFTSQPEKTETRKGNKEFNKGNYADAEADYKKALDRKNNMPEATFNLGDAVYQQKRYEEAVKQFQLSAQNNPDPKVKAKAYHNLGNAHLEQEKWQEAIKAYKNALKINPSDADTKYNLAYANEKLRQQQSGGGQNNKKDPKNDKQDQNQNEQKENNKDQQQAKDQQQKQQQGQQSKLSKEEAEQMLQALQNEEQKTNQKVQQKQIKAVPVKIVKDW